MPTPQQVMTPLERLRFAVDQSQRALTNDGVAGQGGVVAVRRSDLEWLLGQHTTALEMLNAIVAKDAP